MTRASKRDLAARLVWLLMDKCSFLNRGMASIPCGYGKRKWKETILYWQTHYWPCRGSKNNEQRSFRKESFAKQNNCCRKRRTPWTGWWLGWITHYQSRIHQPNALVSQIILECWNHWVRSKGILIPVHLWDIGIWGNQLFTSFMTHTVSLYIWEDSEFRYLFYHLNMSQFFASKFTVVKITQDEIFRLL